MKKQKSKKKLKKIETEHGDVRTRFSAESQQDVLELAPQTPLGIESQAEFQAEVTKD